MFSRLGALLDSFGIPRRRRRGGFFSLEPYRRLRRPGRASDFRTGFEILAGGEPMEQKRMLASSAPRTTPTLVRPISITSTIIS